MFVDSFFFSSTIETVWLNLADKYLTFCFLINLILWKFSQVMSGVLNDTLTPVISRNISVEVV